MITYKLILYSRQPLHLGFALGTRFFYTALFVFSLVPLILGWPLEWPLYGLSLILAIGSLYTEEWFIQGERLVHRHGLLFLARTESFSREEIKDVTVNALGKSDQDDQKKLLRLRPTYVLSFYLKDQGKGEKKKMIEIRKGAKAKSILEEWKDQLELWHRDGNSTDPL